MHYWFRPKRLWGGFAFFVPVSLSGWLSTGLLFLFGLVVLHFVRERSLTLSGTVLRFLPWAITILALFDLLCFRKGEYPSWWRSEEHSKH